MTEGWRVLGDRGRRGCRTTAIAAGTIHVGMKIVSRPSGRFSKPSPCAIFSAPLSMISKIVQAVKAGFNVWRTPARKQPHPARPEHEPLANQERNIGVTRDPLDQDRGEGAD